MRFSFNRAQFSEIVGMVADVVPARSAKPVLQNIQITGNEDGTVTLAGTDLELGITYRAAVEGLTDPDTVLIPAARFSSILRDDWSETITFTSGSGPVEIKTDSGVLHLPSAEDESFPPVPALEGENVIEIHADDLRAAAARTVPFTARGDTRYALNGVFLSVEKNQMEFVASDTHRLSLVKKKVKNAKELKADCIVITKGFQTLARIAEGEETVRLHLGTHELIAETSRATLTARLVDGQFPRYRDVIPSDLDHKVTFDTGLLTRTLRLAGQVSHEETRSVTLRAAGETLSIETPGSDMGDAKMEMPANVEGGDISISFNFVYVLDALKVFQDDTLTLQIRDPDSPARIDIGDCTHVIMPIKPLG